MSKTENPNGFEPEFTAGPPTLVYKTRADYRNLVPITLSEDKKQITSYPHPGDLKVGEQYQTPTLLNDDYLLDNRGINKNVAFLKLSYDDYSKLPEAPPLDRLFDLIIDKDPLLELCNCGNRNAFSNLKHQLNKIIEDRSLRYKCKIDK